MASPFVISAIFLVATLVGCQAAACEGETCPATVTDDSIITEGYDGASMLQHMNRAANKLVSEQGSNVTSHGNKCFISECKCPPEWDEEWKTYDKCEVKSTWCQKPETCSQCNGYWCEWSGESFLQHKKKADNKRVSTQASEKQGSNFTSHGNKCFISECKCPAEWDEEWKTYDKCEMKSTWCQKPETCSDCNGYWCEWSGESLLQHAKKADNKQVSTQASEQGGNATSWGNTCFISECGCSPWDQAWMTYDKCKMKSAWCQRPETCSQCGGSWCDWSGGSLLQHTKKADNKQVSTQASEQGGNATSWGNTCFISECGCAPWDQAWMTYDKCKMKSAWCQRPETCSQCGGSWCDWSGESLLQHTKKADNKQVNTQASEQRDNATSWGNTCFISECGCPPWNQAWMTYDKCKMKSGWCQRPETCSQCGGSWCDWSGESLLQHTKKTDNNQVNTQASEQGDNAMSWGNTCFISECGCPPWDQAWMTYDKCKMKSGWCQRPETCSQCSGSWCDWSGESLLQHAKKTDNKQVNTQASEQGDNATSWGNTCFISECGCPPWNKVWMSYDKCKMKSGWCQRPETCSQCGGSWCDWSGESLLQHTKKTDNNQVNTQASEQGDNATSWGNTCFISECGCPPWDQAWMTYDKCKMKSGWCQRPETCSQCSGSWCDWTG